MIYIYRRAASTGAVALAEALRGRRYRGINYPMQRNVRPGDIVICWGERLDPIPNVRILNGVPFRNKLQDALRLRERGVATIEISQTLPMLPPVIVGPAPIDPALALWQSFQDYLQDAQQLEFSRSPVLIAGLVDMERLARTLTEQLRIPAPMAPPPTPQGPNPIWVGRLANHVGGNDLLHPPLRPDFWVKKEQISREFRVHSFKGRSIRSGMKIPRVGAIPHEWIRSWDGGWRISYDGASVRQKHRDIAHAAIEALELDFGAVDIAERPDGSVFVLEVNRAPGLEGGTITVYANAIQSWLNS